MAFLTESVTSADITGISFKYSGSLTSVALTVAAAGTGIRIETTITGAIYISVTITAITEFVSVFVTTCAFTASLTYRTSFLFASAIIAAVVFAVIVLLVVRFRWWRIILLISGIIIGLCALIIRRFISGILIRRRSVRVFRKLCVFCFRNKFDLAVESADRGNIDIALITNLIDYVLEIIELVSGIGFCPVTVDVCNIDYAAILEISVIDGYIYDVCKCILDISSIKSATDIFFASSFMASLLITSPRSSTKSINDGLI